MQRATGALSSSELILGRYRPIRPLGGGSSGSVWLARDERNGLDVALKIVPREGKTGARAEREAGAAAKLRHPRCQRIYAQASDGSHVYIAYEYVAGSTHARGNAERKADGRRRGRGGRADPRRPGPRAREGNRPPRRQAGERPARGRAGDLDPPARLRPRPLRRGGHADGGRRRARDARVHLAGAPARRGGLSGQRRLVGRCDALGSTRRPASVLGAVTSRHLEEDRGGSTAASRGRGPTCRSLSSPRSHARSIPTRCSVPAPRSSRRRCGSRAASGTSTSTAPAPRPVAPPPLARAVPARPRRALRRLGCRRASLLSDGRAGRAGAGRRSAHLFQPARRARPRARSCRSSRSGTRPSGSRSCTAWQPRSGSCSICASLAPHSRSSSARCSLRSLCSVCSRSSSSPSGRPGAARCTRQLRY